MFTNGILRADSFKMEKRSDNGIGVILLRGCRCRCGHEWLPREKDEKPRVCPKCKSANWDRPYVKTREIKRN